MEKKENIRINCKIRGETAKIIRELKKRGLFTSNTDLVIQAILLLHEKIIERELKEARLNDLRNKGDEW